KLAFERWSPMGARLRTTPRKVAAQQRSRVTVDALLGATARILVKDGYDRASTNRIAHVAGVSIGPLYQYFPSKRGRVAALIDRREQEVSELLGEARGKVATRPVADAARELVKASIDAHRVDPNLHRVLAEQIPRVGRLDNMQAIDRETYALVRSYLEAHRNEIDVADLDLAAFVCFTTLDALTPSAALYPPLVLA